MQAKKPSFWETAETDNCLCSSAFVLFRANAVSASQSSLDQVLLSVLLSLNDLPLVLVG